MRTSVRMHNRRLSSGRNSRGVAHRQMSKAEFENFLTQKKEIAHEILAQEITLCLQKMRYNKL